MLPGLTGGVTFVKFQTMNNRKILRWTILLLLLTGCTSSYITSSWKAPDKLPRKYNKILVLGLIGDPDRSIRESMEQNTVNNLKDLGYNAVCSCDEFSPKSFEGLNEQEALAKINNGGIDAVLTIVLLDKTKEKYYVPGHIEYSPYVVYHNRFWGYYTTMYGRVYSPGYYNTDTKYFWESNLYDMSSNKELLYSAQSQTFDPASSSSLAREYGKMIVKDMLKKNVLEKQPAQPLKSF